MYTHHYSDGNVPGWLARCLLQQQKAHKRWPVMSWETGCRSGTSGMYSTKLLKGKVCCCDWHCIHAWMTLIHSLLAVFQRNDCSWVNAQQQLHFGDQPSGCIKPTMSPTAETLFTLEYAVNVAAQWDWSGGLFVASARCHFTGKSFWIQVGKRKQEETISDLGVQLFMSLIVADSDDKDGSKEHTAQEPSVPSAAWVPSQHRACTTSNCFVVDEFKSTIYD